MNYHGFTAVVSSGSAPTERRLRRVRNSSRFTHGLTAVALAVEL